MEEVRVSVRIPKRLDEMLERYMEERCFKTKSEAIRHILREYLLHVKEARV